MAAPRLALVMGGGGARAAYQVGVLRWMARREPDLPVPILVGVSAGAINAVFLAAHEGNFRSRVDALARLWRRLESREVFRFNSRALVRRMLRGVLRWVPGLSPRPVEEDVVDNRSLWRLLASAFGADEDEIPGIEANLRCGALTSVAVTACSYSTGQSITWIQGRAGAPGGSPLYRPVETRLAVRHIVASTSLPMAFPAVEIDGEWCADGGLGLTAPLAPAAELGADRILTITTRHTGGPGAAPPAPAGAHPCAAETMGSLFDTVFHDFYDTDALRIERRNAIVRAVPPEARGALRTIRPIVIRPSRDLAALSNEFDSVLPRAITRMFPGRSARGRRSNEMLSILMFQPGYLSRPIDLGESDAEARHAELDEFLEGIRRPARPEDEVPRRDLREAPSGPRRAAAAAVTGGEGLSASESRVRSFRSRSAASPSGRRESA